MDNDKNVIYLWNPDNYHFICGLSYSGNIPSNATTVPPITKVGKDEVRLENAIWDPNTNSWQGTSSKVLANEQFQETKDKFTKVNATINSQDSRVSALEEKVRELQSSIDDINNTLLTLFSDDGEDTEDEAQ